MLATAPDDFSALTLKGDLEIATGQRSEATRTLERIVAVRPEAFSSRYMLATNYIQAKEFDKAAAAGRRDQEAGAERLRALLHAIALVAFARGDMPAALDAVQKSLQAAPDFLPARYLSGLVDLKRGAYASAEQSLRTVVAKSPNDDGARIALAQTQLRRGKRAKAQETLEPVMRRQPDNVSALRLAAEIELAMKEPDKAAEYIERANALDRDNIGGRVRLRRGAPCQGRNGPGHPRSRGLSASDPKERGSRTWR